MSSLLAQYIPKRKTKNQPPRRNAARSFLKDPSINRMLTPIAHTGSKRSAYHNSVLAHTQPISLLDQKIEHTGKQRFLNRSYDNQRPRVDAFGFDEENIYMTDDELMKMDNLITSIKEETRSLSREYRTRMTNEHSFPHTDTAEFAKLEGTASFEQLQIAQRQDAERSGNQQEEKQVNPIDLSPITVPIQGSESSDDQTYFNKEIISQGSPVLEPAQRAKEELTNEQKIYPKITTQSDFLREETSQENFSQKNLKPEFDALLNTFQSDEGEIKKSLQESSQIYSLEEERKAKEFEEKEIQTEEASSKESKIVVQKQRSHVELNAFQTYDLLNVQNLVNRLSRDNEVIHSEADAYKQAFEFMVEKHRELQKFLLMEKQKNSVFNELKIKYLQEMKEKEMMASTLEVLKEKQLRLVELIVTHEQHENKMHEEDETLFKGLTSENKKLREMLQLALENLRDLDEESMLLSNQERNLEEKEYHAIIEKLKQKKQSREEKQKLKAIQLELHGQFEIKKEIRPQQEELKEEQVQSGGSQNEEADEIEVNDEVLMGSDMFESPPPPNRQNSLNDPDPLTLLRLKPAGSERGEEKEMLFERQNQAPRLRNPPRIEEEEEKMALQEIEEDQKESPSQPHFRGEENKLSKVSSRALDNLDEKKGEGMRAMKKALMENDRPYRYSDNDEEEVKEPGDRMEVEEDMIYEGQGRMEVPRRDNEEFQWQNLSGMLSGEYQGSGDGNEKEEEEKFKVENEGGQKQEIIEPLEQGEMDERNEPAMEDDEEEGDLFEREDLDYLEGSFEFDEMNMEDFVEEDAPSGEGRRADVSIGSNAPQEGELSPPFKNWSAEEGKLSPFKEDDD